MPDRNASILLQLKADQLLAQSTAAARSFNVLTKEEQAAERQTLALAQSMAQLDAKLGAPAQGAARLRGALAGAAYIDPRQAVGAINQIISLEQKAEAEAVRLAKAQGGLGTAGGLPILPRTLESFGTGAIDQFKSSLLGIVGPAAIATGAISALSGTVESFKEAFQFKAELDQNRASITAQLSGIRDSGQAFQEAALFAQKYKLTQEETTTAIQASVPLLRQSKSSLTDVLTVLSQLQVLKPEQGIEGAAFALAELQGGQTRSLATRFNIPIAKANELKQEIQQGGDAVQVLGAYLDQAGIGAAALEVRTKDAAGALNDAKIAAEDLKLAQGDLAASKGGVAVVQEQAQVFRGLANLLNGEVLSGLKATGATFAANQAAQQAYNEAIAQGKTETQAGAIQQDIYDKVLRATYIDLGLYTPAQEQAAVTTNNHTKAARASADALSDEAIKKLESKVASDQLAQSQTQLDADSRRAAQGLLGAGDQALELARKYGIAKDLAQGLIDAQQQIANKDALADQRKGEQTGTDLSAAEFDSFAKLQHQRQAEDAAAAKTAADKAAADAKRLSDLKLQNDLINAKNSAAKIARLKQELAKTTDPIERQQLTNQIDQERLSTVKAHTGELSKQVTLQESIFDSINKQKDALLDIQALTIKDRQDRRKEDREIAQAQRILGSGRASAEFKAAAQDRIDLINVERQQRAQAILEKQATAGGTLDARGHILQSRPGGAAPQAGTTPQAIGPITPIGAGVPPGRVTAVPASPNVVILRLVDAANRILAESIEPFIVEDLRVTFASSQSGGAH